jgi:hypothetical protein
MTIPTAEKRNHNFSLVWPSYIPRVTKSLWLRFQASAAGTACHQYRAADRYACATLEAVKEQGAGLRSL